MKRTITGLRAWLVQRISAVYMLIFISYLLTHLIVYPPHSHPEWRGWVMDPDVTIATVIFFAALFMLMWVGLRAFTRHSRVNA